MNELNQQFKKEANFFLYQPLSGLQQNVLNQLYSKVFRLTRCSKWKTTKVRNRRKIDKFAYDIYVFITLNSVLYYKIFMVNHFWI